MRVKHRPALLTLHGCAPGTYTHFMCGRYLRRSDKQRIAEAFHLGGLPDDFILPPDFNVAPATFQPVIRLNRHTDEREVILMRWGLIPYFAKSAAEFKGFSTINAKAESISKSGMWKIPFAKRRCLVPADGFYEWQKLDPVAAAKPKQHKKPFAYALRTGEPFAFAGLWDAWKDPATGEWLQTFAIITTDANELTGEVHDRMPVILQPKDYDRWLQRGEAHQPPLDLLRPYPADAMTASPANPAAGNARNNGPEMLNPPPALDPTKASQPDDSDTNGTLW